MIYDLPCHTVARLRQPAIDERVPRRDDGRGDAPTVGRVWFVEGKRVIPRRDGYVPEDLHCGAVAATDHAQVREVREVLEVGLDVVRVGPDLIAHGAPEDGIVGVQPTGQ